MKRMTQTLLLAITLLPTIALAQGDPVKGKEKAAACASCHKLSGISDTPTIPHLAGQRARYIVDQWELFVSGKRKDELMASVATMITNPADIADIAAYYSQLPRNKNKTVTPPKMAALAHGLYNGISNCFQCHGSAGEGMAHKRFDAPVLAGQHKEYTAKTLREFIKGTRLSKEYTMMNDVVTRITDEEIDAIAEYLSNL